MVSNKGRHPRAVVYTEGNVEVREFDTDAERSAFLDSTAEWQWRSGIAKGPSDTAAFPKGRLPQHYYGQPGMASAPLPATEISAPIADATSRLRM